MKLMILLSGTMIDYFRKKSFGLKETFWCRFFTRIVPFYSATFIFRCIVLEVKIDFAEGDFFSQFSFLRSLRFLRKWCVNIHRSLWNAIYDWSIKQENRSNLTKNLKIWRLFSQSFVWVATIDTNSNWWLYLHTLPAYSIMAPGKAFGVVLFSPAMLPTAPVVMRKKLLGAFEFSYNANLVSVKTLRWVVKGCLRTNLKFYTNELQAANYKFSTSFSTNYKLQDFYKRIP